MTDKNTCPIIGVLDNGPAGLSEEARRLIARADLVIGAGRTLALAQPLFKGKTEKEDLTGRLSSLPRWIEGAWQEKKSVVVLATGDPLCHGVARYLHKKLGKKQCPVIANISTLQLACSRFAIDWRDLRIASVHGKGGEEWKPQSGPDHPLYALLQTLRREEKVGVFTSPENSPDRIARMLIAEKMEGLFEMKIAQKLLQEDEQLIEGWSLEKVAGESFADPNVVILQRREAGDSLPLFGLDDDFYAQKRPEKGLITKKEIRALSLARLELRPNSVVWDLGAGSGSVGLEAARLSPEGHVYAIEKNSELAAIVEENRQRLSVTNYTLREGKAPEGLDQWPDPDVVFIGGSGGELEALIELCLERLKEGGRLVMNFVTLENFQRATDKVKERGRPWDVVQVQASRSKPLLHMHRFEAMTPIWMVTVKKI